MTPTRVITRADARAQRRFHRMLVEQVWANPSARHTRLYTEAERLLDALRGEPFEDAAHDAADWRLAVITHEYGCVDDLPAPLAVR